jgi:NAD(P)H-flavin reductase
VFEIREKRMVAPNVHELIIDAPAIAKKAEAGQFVIVMADEFSERVPFTLTDWDAEAGTITLIVLEVGQSSRKVVTKEPGDKIAHVVGPLGIPLEIDNYGTVVVTGGCYGIGSILPVIRAMKKAGNRVVAMVEGHSHYMHYHQDKMAEAADQLVTTTTDGSLGERGHAIDSLKKRLEAGEQVDRIIAIGCTFMMMLTSRETKSFGVKTLVALNPIMVDGTGMCGACRVGVGGETKFACVDGPFFDGHEVDWDELFARKTAYCAEEINSLEQAGPQRGPSRCRRS